MQLEDLLLPDIPASTRNAYLGLSARTEVVDFGPLEDGVIVLDTETTGLSFRDCELIEIAAARLEGRAVVGRYHTFVNPGSPYPRRLRASRTSVTWTWPMLPHRARRSLACPTLWAACL